MPLCRLTSAIDPNPTSAQPKLPRSFWPDYQKHFAEHGYSTLTLKARRTSVPFTFAEAERDLEVLQQRTLSGSNAAIAKALDISIQTVDVHLRSARKNSKVEDTAIAC